MPSSPPTPPTPPPPDENPSPLARILVNIEEPAVEPWAAELTPLRAFEQWLCPQNLIFNRMQRQERHDRVACGQGGVGVSMYV